jgi:hypothetical protein
MKASFVLSQYSSLHVEYFTKECPPFTEGKRLVVSERAPNYQYFALSVSAEEAEGQGAWVLEKVCHFAFMRVKLASSVHIRFHSNLTSHSERREVFVLPIIWGGRIMLLEYGVYNVQYIVVFSFTFS